jgi:hypothetical protein
MITNDWDEALDAWVEQERERLGGPPTPKEVVAYTRGELTDTDAERVRALLVYYPELTSLLVPDDPPVMRRSFIRYLPLAAGVLIALLSIPQWRERSGPYVLESRHVLHAERARNVAEPPVYDLPAGEERYLLTLVPYATSDFTKYRVEIVRDGDVVWQTVTSTPDGTIALSIPRALLEKGTHRIDIYGVDADGEHRLDRYRVRVVR